MTKKGSSKNKEPDTDVVWADQLEAQEGQVAVVYDERETDLEEAAEHTEFQVNRAELVAAREEVATEPDIRPADPDRVRTDVTPAP